MSIKKLKTAGGVATGGLLFLVFLSLPVILLTGAAEFSVWALDWIPSAIGVAMVACVALIPVAVIPHSRRFAANMFMLASMVFGVCMWLYALAFTYLKWGMVGVIIGIMFFGVGVVFAGALAAIFSATWVVLSNLAILLVLYIGTRALGVWLEQLADRRLSMMEAHDGRSIAVTTRDSDFSLKD